MAEKLAIDGGPKVRTEPWPRWPIYGEEEIELIAEILRSGNTHLGRSTVRGNEGRGNEGRVFTIQFRVIPSPLLIYGFSRLWSRGTSIARQSPWGARNDSPANEKPGNWRTSDLTGSSTRSTTLCPVHMRSCRY